MLHFFGFILLFIIIIILFLVVGFIGIFRAAFGRKYRKTVQNRSEQAAEAQSSKPKVFDDDEGEYVEYEELKDEKDTNKKSTDFDTE